MGEFDFFFNNSAFLQKVSRLHRAAALPLLRGLSKAETLQGFEGIVNVKENLQHITLSCRAFYLSLFISPFLWREGRQEKGELGHGSSRRLEHKSAVCCFGRAVLRFYGACV